MTNKHTSPEGSNPPQDPAHLLRYAAGDLPDAESQRLEAASLDDPFLSDALEGLEASKDKVRLEQMAYALNQDLKRRLKKQKQRNKWIGFQTPVWWPWTILILLMLVVMSHLLIRKFAG